MVVPMVEAMTALRSCRAWSASGDGDAAAMASSPCIGPRFAPLTHYQSWPLICQVAMAREANNSTI